MTCPECGTNLPLDDLLIHIDKYCVMTFERAINVGLLSLNDINRYNGKEDASTSPLPKQ